jgi:xanthine dehydrogenase accessory factor
MDDILRALASREMRQNGAALCTIIRTKGSTPRKPGSKMLVYADGSIVGTIGGGEVEGRVIDLAQQAIASGEAEIGSYELIDPGKGDPGICGGSMEVFIDPLMQAADLIVVGGGHVGKAVVHLAKWLGFRVILNDDREEFCSPERVPGADHYIQCQLEDLPDHYQFSPRTVLVLATRSNQVDIQGLPGLLAAPSAYIGVISSKRRWKLTEEQMLELGVKKSDLKRIHAPIGLDIHAESPEEIAVSILAEVLLKTRAGKDKGKS